MMDSSSDRYRTSQEGGPDRSGPRRLLGRLRSLGRRAPLAVDAALALGLGVAAWLLYACSAPAVVNMDGLGYVKLLPHNFAAGHLLYMPLLRAMTSLHHGDGLAAGRALSAIAGGVSIGVFYLCARALLGPDKGRDDDRDGRRGAVVATLGLGLSYAVWVQGADVEAYACALAATVGVLALGIAYRAEPGWLRAFTFGLSLAGAVLVHLTHVLLTPFVIAWTIESAPTRRRGLVHGLFASATGGAVTLAAYAWATLGVRHTDLRGAIRWVGTAGHGFRYEGGPIGRLSDAIFGLARSFVWAPYAYESHPQHMLAQFLLGLVPLVALGVLITVGRRQAARLPWRPLALWFAAYLAMALLFFGSDHERWLFVMPLVWLLGAAGAGALGPARQWAWGLALASYLAVANAATAIGPARLECWDRTRADAAAAPMRDGDLVLFPGHAWDEYVGFYTRTRVVPFPIAYYAGRDGKQAMIERLEREVRQARDRGARVWAVRLLDDNPDDRRGLWELDQLGLPGPELRKLLDRFTVVPTPTPEAQVTIWRLDDRSR